MPGGILNKIGKGATIYVIGMAFSKLFGFFYKVLVARTGPYSYGLLSLGIGVFGFFGIIATMGLDLGVMKFVAYYREKADNQRVKGIITSALKISFTLALLLSFIGFMLAETIALKIFHNPDLTIVLRIFMLIVPFEALRKIFISATKAFQHVEYEVYSRDIIENISKLIFTIIIMLIGVNVAGLSIAFSLAVICSFLASVYFMEYKVFSLIKTKIISIKQSKELFDYSWPLLFSSLLFLLSLWTDSFLIGYFKDASTVGIFNAAGPLAQILYFFPLALMAIFLPIITGLKANGNIIELESTYKTITRWIFISGMIILSAVFIFPIDIISIVFGKDYIAASVPLIILSSGYFINSLIFTSQRVLMAFDRTRLIFIDTLVSFSINIILALWLIPKYGMVGAAIATASSFFILTIITLFEVRLFTGLKTLEWLYFVQSLPVIAAALIVYFFHNYLTGFYSIIGIMAIPAISLIGILVTGAFSIKEKELAMALLNKVRRI